MIQRYANLIDRVKASIIDGLLLIICMYLFSGILSSFESVPNYVRMFLFVLLFLLYDPLFVSIFGGTIGHTYLNLAVKKEKDISQNINFLNALLRFFIKFFLGWLSLLTVTANDKKKAMHDKAAGSVVIKLALKK